MANMVKIERIKHGFLEKTVVLRRKPAYQSLPVGCPLTVQTGLLPTPAGK
jgi:hypothetical protein